MKVTEVSRQTLKKLTGLDGIAGYTYPARIFIRKDLPEALKKITLQHEIVHALLGIEGPLSLKKLFKKVGTALISPAAAITGGLLGLGKTLGAPKIPSPPAQIASAAEASRAVGEELQKKAQDVWKEYERLKTEGLPPVYEEALKQQRIQAEKALKDVYAKAGLSESTMMQQDLARIGIDYEIQKAFLADELARARFADYMNLTNLSLGAINQQMAGVQQYYSDTLSQFQLLEQRRQGTLGLLGNILSLAGFIWAFA